MTDPIQQDNRAPEPTQEQTEAARAYVRSVDFLECEHLAQWLAQREALKDAECAKSVPTGFYDVDGQVGSGYCDSQAILNLRQTEHNAVDTSSTQKSVASRFDI